MEPLETILDEYPCLKEITVKKLLTNSKFFCGYYDSANEEFVVLLNNENEKLVYDIRLDITNEKLKTIKRNAIVVDQFSNKNIVDINCNEYHMTCLTDSGEVYTWSHTYPEDCLTVGQRFHAKQYEALTNKNIVSISCGKKHNLALTSDGHVYAWGDNEFGQLGIGSDYCTRTPTRIDTFPQNDAQMAAIACGQHHSVALSRNGHVYSFGVCNCEPSLEDNSLRFEYQKSATRVEVGNGNGVRIAKIACSFADSVLLSRAGDLYSFCNKAYSRKVYTEYKYSIIDKQMVATKVVKAVKKTLFAGLIHKLNNNFGSKNKFVDIYSDRMFNYTIVSSESKCYLLNYEKLEKSEFDSIKKAVVYYLKNYDDFPPYLCLGMISKPILL